MNGNDLTNLIQDYYDHKNLKFPDFHQALSFVHTELGEVYELDLARVSGWVRNNPETKPKFSKESLGEELGDAIMMLVVAGMAEGVDPLKSLEEKIKAKMAGPTLLGSHNGVEVFGERTLKSTSFTVNLEELDDKRTDAQIKFTEGFSGGN